MEISEAIAWIREHGVSSFVSYIAGVLSAFAGVWYRNQTEIGRSQAENVRALITPADRLSRALERGREQYEAMATADPKRVPDLFRTIEVLVAAEDVTSLNTAMDRANSLPVPCLNRWRDAVSAVRQVEKHHSQLRNLLGRPGSRAEIVERRHEYGDQMRRAIDCLADAALETREFAPKDARSSIAKLTERKTR